MSYSFPYRSKVTFGSENFATVPNKSTGGVTQMLVLLKTDQLETLVSFFPRVQGFGGKVQ